MRWRRPSFRLLGLIACLGAALLVAQCKRAALPQDEEKAVLLPTPASSATATGRSEPTPSSTLALAAPPATVPGDTPTATLTPISTGTASATRTAVPSPTVTFERGPLKLVIAHTNDTLGEIVPCG